MRIRTSFILALLVFALGCATSTEDTTNKWEIERDELRAQIELRLDRIEERLTELKAELEQAGTQTDQIMPKITKLEQAQYDLQLHLNEIAHQTEETWQRWTAEVKETLNEAEEDLHSAVRG